MKEKIMSINTYPNKTINELFGIEGQYVWPDNINVIPEDAEVDTSFGLPDRTGTFHTKETIKRMCDVQKNKVISVEQKNKISESLKGFKHTEETKEKMRQSAIRRWNK